ncbi:hypothetical protein GCM10027445_51510 [Amycolatopsis endophytica]
MVSRKSKHAARKSQHANRNGKHASRSGQHAARRAVLAAPGTVFAVPGGVLAARGAVFAELHVRGLRPAARRRPGALSAGLSSPATDPRPSLAVDQAGQGTFSRLDASARSPKH